MHLSLPLAILLGAASSLASPAFSNVTQRRCGTQTTPEAARASREHFKAHEKSLDDLSIFASSTIPVYFHVVSKDKTAAGGNVADSQIKEQISVLNTGYANMGVKFELKQTTRTVNRKWFEKVDGKSPLLVDMGKALRKGKANALNVWTVGFEVGPDKGLLGCATYPWEFSDWSEVDGVVLNFRALPGGSAVKYNTGKTLTHEVGHWFGLYHPFDNTENCTGTGDEVDDTPMEQGYEFDCPIGRDSCPGGGPDSIQNYMSWSDDSCLTQFTTGQGKRVAAMSRTYRGIRI